MTEISDIFLNEIYGHLSDLSDYSKEEITKIFYFSTKLIDNQKLQKCLQIIRNSIYFKLFNESNISELLNFLFLILKDLNLKSNPAHLLSVQIIHNLIASEFDLSKNKIVLAEIVKVLVTLSSTEDCSMRCKSIIWHLFYRLLNSVLDADFITFAINASNIESILSMEDNELAENGETLLSSLISDSNLFVVHFDSLNNECKNNLLLLLQVNNTLSDENLTYLIDYVVEMMKPKYFFKLHSKIGMNIWKEILFCLSKISDLNKKLSFSVIQIIIENIIRALKTLAEVDGDLNEDITFKSQYSPIKNETLEERVIYNVKYLLITLLSQLSFENKNIQNFISDLGGVEIVMSSTRIDLCNPILYQSSIFAIRNICLNNEAICERIKQYTQIKSNDKQLLELLNLRAVERDGITLYAPLR